MPILGYLRGLQGRSTMVWSRGFTPGLACRGGGPTGIASIHMAPRETDTALRWMEEAIDSRDPRILDEDAFVGLSIERQLGKLSD